MKVKRFHPDAVLPVRAHTRDAGMDLASVEDIVIAPGTCKLVSTGIGVAVPKGTYGRLAPRSSVSKKNVFVNAGVIDFGYRGEIKCILANNGTEDFPVKKGDRICQLILEKIIDDCVVEEVEELDETARGAGGFGSTGK
jgi:deoxyuridine 5'-triphosphate nucleotidohydrolase